MDDEEASPTLTREFDLTGILAAKCSAPWFWYRFASSCILLGLSAGCQTAPGSASESTQPRVEITNECLSLGPELMSLALEQKSARFWTLCDAAIPDICSEFIEDDELTNQEIALCRVRVCEQSPVDWACGRELSPIPALYVIAGISEEAPPTGFLDAVNGTAEEAARVSMQAENILGEAQRRVISFAVMADLYGRTNIIPILSPR